MEEDRSKVPATTKLGGAYSKTKQRVLNKMGRRTTLTRNHRVDYISRKVDELRGNKKKVTALASSLRSHIDKTVDRAMELNALMLDVWKEELGAREWDEGARAYVRTMGSDDQQTLSKLEEAYDSFQQGIKTACDSFYRSLLDTESQPLTFCSAEEEICVSNIKKIKEKYKVARTEYSDAMINLEMEQSTGNEPRQKTVQRAEDKQRIYEEQGEKFAEEALKFETMYRDELAQRVSAHFTAQMHFARAVSSVVKEVHPFTRSLTLDLEVLKAQLRKDAEQDLSDDDMDVDLQQAKKTLPPVDSMGKRSTSSKKEKKEKSSSSKKSKEKKADLTEPDGDHRNASTSSAKASKANPFSDRGDAESMSTSSTAGVPAASNPFQNPFEQTTVNPSSDHAEPVHVWGSQVPAPTQPPPGHTDPFAGFDF
ncbi:hypothetical protein FVE85_0587 [Porphyridium purpureum]|uniref:BAR domain-containing protein n=1 Tax=Porphyridium purpureum TaxID=35688 RepID=A0A5J4Z0I2_PORPP|nr:hypothetical protein FVE85_0587 [Porphyridium purpureum]|eukprot:POR7243..scf208_2